jgi:predicted ribosome quality control (RQC) complex YloA/Tae2 family protein
MIEKKIFFDKLKLEISFYIGQNAQENNNLVSQSNDNDLWLHVSEFSSPHVIASIHAINIDRKNLKYVIKQGAILCKQYSRYKSDKKLDIIYTKIKNVTLTDVIGRVETVDIKCVTI